MQPYQLRRLLYEADCSRYTIEEYIGHVYIYVPKRKVVVIQSVLDSYATLGSQFLVFELPWL